MRRSSAPNGSSRAGGSAATNDHDGAGDPHAALGHGTGGHQAPVASQTPLPSPTSAELARRLRAAVRLDYQMQADYTYLERRRDVKISKLGKVTIGPVRTFRVLPSPVSGQTYKRLIAVDDKPLPADELARRDAEHANDIKEAQALQARETPSQRAERLERSTREQRERDAILEDAFRAYDAVIERREIVDGMPVLVARMTPRQDAPVTTREGRWMSHFEGHLWVAEADYQIVKVDMRATSDVTIGWGVVGRIQKGSRVLLRAPPHRQRLAANRDDLRSQRPNLDFPPLPVLRDDDVF